ncbi:MAG TPA: dihydrodipicolinate synthase family protein [Gaiellaceae bacterium]|nr:dihydrodipicolinate synthase family protein [Gaiellaceae bacterium]
MLRGTIAAALTPLRDDGATVDADAIGAYTDFLAAGGVDGVLALGSTGEGILLEPAERRLVAERFREATAGRLALAVHVGAITTAGTAALAEHARSIGADAVAAIAPPYYAYDADALLEHFAAAAGACAPVPFYVYEFAARSGYPIPVAVVERLRERAPNLRGMKVSDKPFSAVEPYLLEGLDIFVGAEPLLPQALAAGAAGAVSGLASVLPELVASLVREPSEERAREAEERRAALEPLIPNAKARLAGLGLMRRDVRAPLRPAA